MPCSLMHRGRSNMSSNEEITAALLVVRDRCERAGIDWDGEMREITAAMLHAAKLVRDAKMEREIAKMSHPNEAN